MNLIGHFFPVKISFEFKMFKKDLAIIRTKKITKSDLNFNKIVLLFLFLKFLIANNVFSECEEMGRRGG